MGWSTREIAELAGTSLRAVRHYHEVGLLPEPERRANGYKQYGVPHLVRVLRIKRLTDLGFSLSRIAAMGADDDQPDDALRTLDAELAATVERLQRARTDIALILRRPLPAGPPAEPAPVGRERTMTGADRSLVVVLSRGLGPPSVQARTALLADAPADPALTDFDRLTADAGDDDRRELAERLAPYVRALHAGHPDRGEPHQPDAAAVPQQARRAADTAMLDLYNPAQLDVVDRVHDMLDADPG